MSWALEKTCCLPILETQPYCIQLACLSLSSSSHSYTCQRSRQVNPREGTNPNHPTCHWGFTLEHGGALDIKRSSHPVSGSSVWLVPHQVLQDSCHQPCQSAPLWWPWRTSTWLFRGHRFYIYTLPRPHWHPTRISGWNTFHGWEQFCPGSNQVRREGSSCFRSNHLVSVTRLRDINTKGQIDCPYSGKSVMIYTDSSYVLAMAHVHSAFYKEQGLMKEGHQK